MNQGALSWPFAPLEPGAYRTILADPPWRFSGGKKSRPQHYTRMSDRELMRLPVEALAHPEGAWLFLWVTSPRLFLVKPIVRAWGFAYSGRAFVWIKTRTTGELHVGQGYTTRKNAEDVLLFRRGSPKRHAKDVHEVVLSPVRQHSQKPKEVRQRIERFCPGPYAELFARDTAPEWGSWGSEVGKFGRAAA